MRMRIIFVAVIAVLLVAGTTASAMCEMICLPQAQTSACCPHQAQHLMTHCSHFGEASLASGHSCVHPQDNAAIASIVVPAPLFADGVMPSASVAYLPALYPDLIPLKLSRPSSNIPLRI